MECDFKKLATIQSAATRRSSALFTQIRPALAALAESALSFECPSPTQACRQRAPQPLKAVDLFRVGRDSQPCLCTLFYLTILTIWIFLQYDLMSPASFTGLEFDPEVDSLVGECRRAQRPDQPSQLCWRDLAG